ncbi:tetratricopeptide repeat protein [Pseudomonas synxantha BG33R]|uniref:Tetratricopeptide repeat protein n=1 Tax=Pseudomonas synxantha TaxID=47883 RepID=A0A5D3GIH5_9PSED|nr:MULTISPECIES: tetratricopeptide repeat protein [Pseudomonas]MBY8971558.1 tetratricopeptide repeat protein [Pseudomonas sp. P867]MCK3823823.1 tetratricopeptide repeat protein [Pseudomonas sp. W2Aug9]MCK3830231.1 tetratricopeptide repeat protein [Pseudomonas fluorescens]MCK3836369.1 tetratricopeptide repeat protein [Pseudomonas sp. NCIMB 10586]MCK3844859.1 tetratricopeptide repeat protein [Pseudomonas sp. W15Feb34]MCK3849154.1 tetratricopeptide repeat protein [Pseudomonas sp. W2Jun17]MCK386
MNKLWIPAITALALLGGCSSVQRGSIPVVDSSTSVSNNDRISANGGFRQTVVKRPAQAATQAIPQDSGVVVMVPGSGAATSAPISAEPWTPGPSTSGPVNATPIQTAPVNQGTYNMPSTPSGIPSSSNAGGLSADEQLDGPVLALLTTAQQQQAGGDLNGASSSLERAQRVAPREPQVLYRLAQVRMAQGDAPQAEQFARRGLSLANGRPDLQASLWALIGDARAAQGDAAGAAQARQKAKVSL